MHNYSDFNWHHSCQTRQHGSKQSWQCKVLVFQCCQWCMPQYTHLIYSYPEDNFYAVTSRTKENLAIRVWNLCHTQRGEKQPSQDTLQARKQARHLKVRLLYTMTEPKPRILHCALYTVRGVRWTWSWHAIKLNSEFLRFGKPRWKQLRPLFVVY